MSLRACARLLTVFAVALGALAPPVSAAPGEGGVLVADPTVTLPDLGLAPDIALFGAQGAQSLTIPVPPGTTPTAIVTTGALPVFVGSGVVTVSQEDRVLARVDVPPGPPTRLELPLAGVRVVENAATVQIRSYLLPLPDYCPDPSNPLRLTDAAVRFSGVETRPASVSEFLPPVLRALTVYLDPQPSAVEADTAVQVAAAVVARYGTQDVRVTLAPSDGPPVPADPAFSREILIEESARKGVSLVGGGAVPALRIAGTAAELTNQARLLSSGMARYALTSEAVVGPLTTVPEIPPDLTTLRALGQPGVNATALRPQVGIPLDQTRLGRPVRDVRVHLVGSYTPLAPSVGGQLVVSVAGQTLARWPAEASGSIDRWVDVPDDVLGRYTVLNVAVDIAGGIGRCGEFAPVTLTVDGATEVSTRAASPPVPQGFQSLPQALMPLVQVGIGDDRFADTARAVAIVTGLQRLSAVPLDTEVVGLDAVVASDRPAIAIAADRWSHPEVPLPVRAPRELPASIGVVGVDGRPDSTELEPGLRFGSLQTVVHNGRTMLVATSNGSPDQLDALLAYLDQGSRRWADLDAVALLQVPGRPPLTVPLAAPAPAPTSASGDGGGPGGGVVAAAAVAGLATLVGALVLLRLRRRPST